MPYTSGNDNAAIKIQISTPSAGAQKYSKMLLPLIKSRLGAAILKPRFSHTFSCLDDLLISSFQP